MKKTYCNPLDLSYRYQHHNEGGKRAGVREGADPTLVLFKGTCYLFVSMSAGFWYSQDLLNWQFHANENLLIYDYAPDVRQIGDAVGKEMVQFGITVWLAPGMNIHRNPLGGRTFEYYSEDPVLSGEMAAALTLGVQSHSGVGTCIKHFCCNNTEDNRNGISANLSERALREIYLKGFEIAVKKSQPKAVMSSYNMVNHVYTPNSHDLLTEILRCEWGFQGLVMTDWISTNEKAADPALCAPAGNDLIMPGNDYDRNGILAAIESGAISHETVRRCACRVLRLMLNANTPVLI